MYIYIYESTDGPSDPLWVKTCQITSPKSSVTLRTKLTPLPASPREACRKFLRPFILLFIISICKSRWIFDGIHLARTNFQNEAPSEPTRIPKTITNLPNRKVMYRKGKNNDPAHPAQFSLIVAPIRSVLRDVLQVIIRRTTGRTDRGRTTTTDEWYMVNL